MTLSRSTISSPSGITVGGDVRGPRVGEVVPFVDAFGTELEGAEGKGEDIVSTLSATVVYQFLGGGLLTRRSYPATRFSSDGCRPSTPRIVFALKNSVCQS